MSMMCPGISYSTVHNLIFHNNGSVQNNKHFQEFCNRKQSHFAFSGGITESMIDSETRTLKEDPAQMKYDDSLSELAYDYEIMWLGLNRIFTSFSTRSVT